MFYLSKKSACTGIDKIKTYNVTSKPTLGQNY